MVVRLSKIPIKCEPYSLDATIKKFIDISVFFRTAMV